MLSSIGGTLSNSLRIDTSSTVRVQRHTYTLVDAFAPFLTTGFNQLHRYGDAAERRCRFVISVASKLGSIASIAEAASIITDAIRSKLSKLSKLLSISVESIEGGKSVSSNGIDSLVAWSFARCPSQEPQG
ncbi:uncharacterized protein CIMG_01390 [Coccidioides immitis RS]|uniref:Uncharacterized protein n=1 Tax=Coccidioides immitis (strain RS) TaxID=246410 RepID=J3KJ37_COCIM|nr:uncharacterized protein CIMG_01390 [Coccidioides immitis RS]EAS36036.3 hypothetical protein CIMG_01390 [Coccidioides immitis RS]